MKTISQMDGNEKIFFLLFGLISTVTIYQYRLGISGNDFWWHVKAGEWMVTNKAIPTVDVFSWYAKQNNIEWISHEWLFDVIFYKIYNIGGTLSIFLISMLSALLMALLILYWNRFRIKASLFLSTLFLAPMILLLPMYFYGRPQLISYFLLYATLYCLYKYRENANSKVVFLVPIISIFWSNFHGGSSNLPYILCFIFFLSGSFEFTFGKLISNKLSTKQLKTYLAIGILSLFALIVSPHGMDMLIYPYINIGDSFLQSFISEWSSPDAKNYFDLLVFFLPLFMVCLTLVTTDKQVKIVDLIILLFFAYMSFRSIRFSILFYIAASFFIMEYFIPMKLKPMNSRPDKIVLLILIVIMLSINVYSINSIIKTTKGDELISVALDMKYIDLVKKESPNRLYNDYNFGETLIYNDVYTFVDARADIFSKYNMHDAMSLLYLKETNEEEKQKIFDPEKLIKKYDFDAFLIQPDRNLASYLNSYPDKYELVMKDDNAVYFRCIN